MKVREKTVIIYSKYSLQIAVTASKMLALN